MAVVLSLVEGSLDAWGDGGDGPTVLWLHALATATHWKGRGCGRHAVRCAMDIAHARAADLYVLCAQGNGFLPAFYHSLGFHEVKRAHNHVSPSWGAAGAFPHRVQRGVAQLEALGFHVKLGRHALNQRGVVSDTPEHRAADLHAMFHDPDVRAIIATIGGDHACHVLPLLDFASIRDSPTLFMGYSDMTVLNIAICQQTGVVTCHGPMLLTDFAEYPRLFAYTKQSFLRTVCEARPVGRVAPCDAWTEEFLNPAIRAADWLSRPD